MIAITVEILCWAGVWWVISETIKYVAGVPKKLQQIEDEKKRKIAIANYYGNFLSLAHAFFMISLSLNCLSLNPLVGSREFSGSELLLIKASFGYFVLDTLLGVQGGFNDLWMNIHHVVIFVCFLQALYYNNCAVELLLALLVGELTNPFNILRQIFEVLEQPSKSSEMGKYFVVLFVPLRGVVSTLLGRWTIMNPDLNYVLKVTVSSMLFVGFVWIWKIVNLGVKQLATENPSNQSFQKVYAFFKSIRKYEIAWNGLTGLLSFYWLGLSIYRDVYGWPQ